MLDNYDVNEDGVIYQVDRTPFDYTDGYNNYLNKIKELSKYNSYSRLGYIIGSIGKVPDSILDVGYGIGDFLEACVQIPNRYGHDISGYPIPDGCIFMESMLSRHYEVITFFDSLEHMDDIEFVKDLQCNYVCISVPNCHYFNDEWFTNWKHRKPNEHLWHFNEDSLKSFMKRMGYTCINTCNIEDTIRKNNQPYSNILTGIFKKDEY